MRPASSLATVAQIHHSSSRIGLFEARARSSWPSPRFRSLLAPPVVLGIAAVGYLRTTLLLPAFAEASVSLHRSSSQ